MGQEMGPPIEHFRTQKAPKTDETLRAVFNTLIQAYDTVRQGRVTNAKTIRLLARQFEAIADSPEASDVFPYDAGRAAAALYNWALDIDMRAGTSGQASRSIDDVGLVEPFSETSQTTTADVSRTTEKVKPLDRPTPSRDNTRDLAQGGTMERDRQTQKRINEGLGMSAIPEQKSEVSGVARELKVTPGIQLDLIDPSVTWRALLELAKIGKEELTEGELAEEEVVESSIDHNSIWDEWEG